MTLHHKGCGGELHIGEWTDYGKDFGVLPDYYCNKCGDFLAGDAQIEESVDEIQFGVSKDKRKPKRIKRNTR